MARKKSTRTHVSPGIYYKETEVSYNTKSLGITTLGLAGETVKGPAFQPISISDWSEFQTYFGGTNTEKFRGSQYPKYELPYIAQEFLKQSKQLEVVRTLGLSGVNAGPAWVITATKHNCGKGYTYETVRDEDGKEVEIKDFTISAGTKNDTKSGLYGEDGSQFTFNKMKPRIAEAGDTLVNDNSEFCVIDGYVNRDTDIIYFDDSAEDYFEKLPKGIQIDFGTYDNIQKFNDENTDNIGGAFLYIGLDDVITDGKLTVMYELNTDGVIALHYDNISTENAEEVTSYPSEGVVNYLANECQTKVRCVKDPDGNVYKYIMVPKNQMDKLFEETYKIESYDKESDFNISKFTVYHYGYTNVDENNVQLVENSGKVIATKETRSEEQICEEMVDAEYNNVAIAIIRSRGEHKHAVPSGVDECGNTTYTYDGIEYYAKSVNLIPSTTLTLGDDCNPGYNTVTGDFNINSSNYGKFNIAVDSVKGCELCGIDTYIKHEYSVSLNPSDNNYITKVLGTDPEVGDADIYVEELYDVALEQLINAGEINAINSEIAKYPVVTIIPDHAPVDDLLTLDPSNLTKRYLGKRYLYTYSESLQNNINVRTSNDNGVTWTEGRGIVGHIYTVISWNNPDTGKKEYFYGEYRNEDGGILTGKNKFTEYLTFYQYYRDVVKNDGILRNCVKVASDDCYYVYADFDEADTANEGDVRPITLDFNNYKEEYRYASTPWIVSEMKGSGNNVKLHKLFRFHTISDGNTANTEVKVSIENIDPDMQTFDVVIRSFYDSDVNPNILEKYGKCSLIPGESNYLGLRIGTLDGTYVSQSAYVTVEINEDDVTSMSIPCGFLGYPVRNYNGFGMYEINDNKSLSTTIKQPYVKFNTSLDDEMKVKKQYFGMSDLIGIDADILSYKGVEAYNEDPEYLTPCFHLDSRILNGTPTGIDNGIYYVEEDGNRQVVNVDGVTGYNWITVARTETTSAGIEPRIGTEDVMENTIYEDKASRKFTVCFYGGWDGWDYYRTSRSNGDEYRYNKYKGAINKTSGQGTMFSVIKDPEAYGFESETKVITSDYYAYLAGVRQLDNPKTVAINLFATPGIDYVNQTALVQDIIDIIEEDRGDALYVVTTPDKPFGAGDSKSEMYSAEEVVYNLEDSEIDTNYACTYYPWEQYYDSANNQFIYLPVTRDVVRNMGYTDNIAHPWFASAGWNRGDVSGVSPKRKLKRAEQDILYDGRINYVNSFAKEGDRIWGDKNLQVHDGVMNRISKRRLVLCLKTLLSTACVGLLFDPNDSSMSNTLYSVIKATLDPIKSAHGIYDYRTSVDDSVEAKDRLELPAKIQIQPTSILEYIDIELAVTPQGVQMY